MNVKRKTGRYAWRWCDADLLIGASWEKRMSVNYVILILASLLRELRSFFSRLFDLLILILLVKGFNI